MKNRSLRIKNMDANKIFSAFKNAMKHQEIISLLIKSFFSESYPGDNIKHV